MKLKLCLRGRGGFSLTENGQAIYQAAQAMFVSHSALSRHITLLKEHLDTQGFERKQYLEISFNLQTLEPQKIFII
jgi:DNA-binding transcriptional LysR family regulator